jgi:hypothetical protein
MNTWKIRSLIATALLCLGAAAARAQTTIVSATVTDINGLAYSYATVTATLVPSTASPTVGGQQIQGTSGPANLNVAGKFSMTLFSNPSISPAGTYWQFTVSIAPGIYPPAGTGPQVCTTGLLTISGATQDITSSLNACPILSNVTGSSLSLTDGHIYVGNSLNKPADVAMSGDASITDTGKVTVNAINGLAMPAAAKLLGSNSSSQPIPAALTSAHLYVGNGSNLPADVAMSGDASIDNTGKVTVNAINGLAMPAAVAVLGTNGSSQPVAATAHGVATPLLCLDSSGSGATQSCSTTPSFTPVAGDTIIYKTTTTNSGDLTINVNSLGAKHARKWQGSAVLAAGDLVAGIYMLATYDGSYWEFYTIGNIPSSGVSEATFTSPQSLTNASKVFFASAHTLTRFYATAIVSAVGCSIPEQVAVEDTTSSTNLATLTLSNGAGDVDSGALSVAMTAGHLFVFAVAIAPSGCSVTPVYNYAATYQ